MVKEVTHLLFVFVRLPKYISLRHGWSYLQVLGAIFVAYPVTGDRAPLVPAVWKDSQTNTRAAQWDKRYLLNLTSW